MICGTPRTVWLRALSTTVSPKELLRQHSDMVDGLVRTAFRKAQSTVHAPSVCLMAVGGYGRSELAPYSDIDLLLLYAPSEKSDLSPLISGILYPLWDLGLDVSCSSRSIPECVKMAQADLQVKTSLIDARYLDGEYEFFRSLYGLFSKKILHRHVHEFAATLMGELRQRHQKYEVPEYVLEPNIKEGEGGLRDFQMGCWIVRAKYKTDRWESILFPDHSRTLEKGVDFLWTLRNQLHLAQRKETGRSDLRTSGKDRTHSRFSFGTNGNRGDDAAVPYLGPEGPQLQCRSSRKRRFQSPPALRGDGVTSNGAGSMRTSASGTGSCVSLTLSCSSGILPS